MDDEDEFTECNTPADIWKRKPIEPGDKDCCGDGCSLCVFDIYKQELKLWKDLCLKNASGNSLQNDSLVVEPSQYCQLELVEILPVSSDTNLYKFAIPFYGMLKGDPVRHLIARGYVNDRCVTRQYTPVSKLEAKGYFQVLIKLYKDGLMSKYIEAWQIGSKIEWRGTFTEFRYTPNKYGSLLLLAAGTGLTPMIQIIRAVLSNDQDETTIRVMLCFLNYKDIPMKQFFDNCKDYWNFNIEYFLSQDSGETAFKYGDKVVLGKLNPDLITSKLKDFKGKVLICGPKTFNNDMKMAAVKADVFVFN